MSGGAGRAGGIVAVVIGAACGVVFLALGARAIGPGTVRFPAPGPRDVGLASTSLRVDSIALHAAPADGGTCRIDIAITNVGDKDAVGVGYVLEDEGVVVDYDEAMVLHAGARDRRELRWVPKGHEAHDLRVVVGDGNVHWVRHELHTGVFEDAILPVRRHRSASASSLAGLAGALLATVARAIAPHLRVAPIEVVPERTPDLAGP
jgi:CARDB protein